MTSPKPRRFDFYPDDFIAGVGELTLAERGLLWTHASLQYSRGGPAIAPEHLRRQCPDDARVYNRSLARLLALGKLQWTEDGKLTQKRCVTEAENARRRLIISAENGRKGGRPFNKNNDVAKPGGFPRAREGVAKTITNTFTGEKGDDGLGRSAPLESPISEDEIKAVGELVSQATRVLGQPKKIIRDLEAYDAAIGQSVWNAWLNRLSRYVMSEFDAKASMPKLEAIEQARAAGSRRVTDLAVRKILNEIAREIAARERGGRAAA